MKDMFPENLGLLGKVLDLRLQRQNVVMTNLANMDIPSFKARRLEFEKELQSALNIGTKLTRTSNEHTPGAFDERTFKGELDKGWKPQVVAGLDAVDMDKEMAIMAKNTLMYNAIGDITKKSFEGLQKVIADGKA